MNEIRRLWVREVSRGPMLEREVLEIEAGRGVVGDHTLDAKRHVTIVFEDDWAEAVAALGRPVDPSARRANVLVSGGRGRDLVGRRIRLGEIEIDVRGIVAPCGRMDEAAEGLRAALEPDARGGVWGVALTGGTLRIGDGLAAVPAGEIDSRS